MYFARFLAIFLGFTSQVFAADSFDPHHGSFSIGLGTTEMGRTIAFDYRSPSFFRHEAFNALQKNVIGHGIVAKLGSLEIPNFARPDEPKLESEIVLLSGLGMHTVQAVDSGNYFLTGTVMGEYADADAAISSHSDKWGLLVTIGAALPTMAFNPLFGGDPDMGFLGFEGTFRFNEGLRADKVAGEPRIMPSSEVAVRFGTFF